MSKIESLDAAQQARLRACRDFWLASVKDQGGAHMVPVWAVLVNGALYIGTEPRSKKVANIRAHPEVALAVTDTRDVLIIEGRATLLEGNAPPDVALRFQEKYEWTFEPGGGEWVLIKVIPEKVLAWNSNEG